MKNKKQIKQTIKTMKQVSCRKKKTTKQQQQQQKQSKHNKEESVCFFRILLESEHQPEAARSFFSVNGKTPNFFPDVRRQACQ